MDRCPNCGSELNIDEKASGRCFTCNSVFESILPGDKKKNTQRTLYSNNGKCPYCGKILSEDEKCIYKCITCGKRFLTHTSKELPHTSIDNSERELHEAVKQIAKDVRFFRNLVIGFIIMSIVFAIVYYNVYMKPLVELSKNL